MQSGTAVIQEIPCEKQCDPLHILLHYLSGQEGASRRKGHVLRSGDKKIEVRHGRHHVSSMWGEVRVGR